MTGMGGSPGSGDPLIVQAFHTALLRQGAVLFIGLVVIAVAWNAFRTLQYRRAVAAGEPFPPPRRRLGPEPVGRRVLRFGFGGLWILDGLLQLQSGMPVGLPGNVLQPAAASSPSWVRHLVALGADAWTRHPASAAAAAVWIQLGVGILLLVAPRGRWSQAAGLVSVGWALVVWAFGEAFGGIFAPGLTILFGAPGAVLLYAAAGGLVALPERSWVGERLGRTVTATVGVFLLGMAVLQAWPGRGFWQGGTSARPGTLGGMVTQMAGTPQPHPLASAVSSFAGFDIAHGWGVNLVVVVALVLVGGALVSGRRRLLLPAVGVLAVLGLADWVLVEDWGWFGGTGTDPNSMVPLLLVVVAGALAVVRAPAIDAVAHPVAVASTDGQVEPTGAVDDAVPDAPPDAVPDAPRRRSWERVDSGYSGRIALSLAAALVVVVGTVPMVTAAAAGTSDTVLAVAQDGSPNVLSGPAPDFHLVDQNGRPVSLATLHGSTVALTFLDPVCTTDCPVIAQEFRVADQMLGSAASKVTMVAIAANPQYNSVAVLRTFNGKEGLDSVPNWLFLTGPLPELTSAWNAYGINVAQAPAGSMTVHSELAYVIDADGNTRRVMSTDPASGPAGESSFSAVLASQILQVVHP